MISASNLFSIALPFSILVALGGHAVMLRRDLGLFSRRPKPVHTPIEPATSHPLERPKPQVQTPAINENDIDTQVLKPNAPPMETEFDVNNPRDFSNSDYEETGKIR